MVLAYSERVPYLREVEPTEDVDVAYQRENPDGREAEVIDLTRRRSRKRMRESAVLDDQLMIDPLYLRPVDKWVLMQEWRHEESRPLALDPIWQEQNKARTAWRTLEWGMKD